MKTPKVKRIKFLVEVEKALNKTAVKEFLPLQDGDLENTYADVNDLTDIFNYKPNTQIETGISKFIEWYNRYYNNKNS